jgi:carbohydrate kinase (thermoresistant glucokinase family)
MCSHVIVMGVSGSGKTAIAHALAKELGTEFVEGDDHHPAANVEKMAAGIPLTDEDRWPWLRTLATLIAERHARGAGTVLACSALRRAYRDVLRAAVPREESFVLQLDPDEATLRSRLEQRRSHYMPTSLLESQLATLEPLGSDEHGVVIVDAAQPERDVAAEALAAVRAWHGTLPPGR